MKKTLKDIILENQQLNFRRGFVRELTIPYNSGLIVSLIGARRSGKTFVLFNTIDRMLKSGVKREQILFINFEDERLLMNTEHLDLIFQAYGELYPNQDMEEVYVFFDEVQNVDLWEKFVRRIYDAKTRRIFITGSNSKLLSKEIATALRGRTITYTVYPFSFREYLDSQNIEHQFHPQKNRNIIAHQLEKFMINGGFAETVGADDKIRVKILQEYFNVMIFRDIVERYQVKNIDVLKFFIKKIMAGVTVPFSVNKAFNDLKSMGYKISNNYLYDYYNYCNDIFMCQSINKFDFSDIKQAKSDKKTYIIDNGLLSSIEFSISKNRGKLFENMVFLELIKMEYEVFYFKNRYECDFIIHSEGNYQPVQVAVDLSNDTTTKREIKGLLEACDYLKIKKGTIITFEDEDTIKDGKYEIAVVPFYKYFLGENESR